MARPKGSKNKVKEPEETAPEKQFKKELHDKGFAITPNKGILAVNADQFNKMPDDWFSLGKVAKLQWLTANRKK